MIIPHTKKMSLSKKKTNKLKKKTQKKKKPNPFFTLKARGLHSQPTPPHFFDTTQEIFIFPSPSLTNKGPSQRSYKKD
jgi:hypothetical protein